MNRMEQADALGRLIGDAFEDAVWPEPQNLVPHPLTRSSESTFRDLGRAPHSEPHFGGKRQSDLTQIDAGMFEELISMTGPAVRYYLPCFLKHVLGKPDFIDVIALVDFLDVEKSASQGFTWPRFTNEQKAAVFAVVDYLQRHIRSYGLGESEDDCIERLQKVRQQWKVS